MSFTVPNVADAGNVTQAQVDKVDLDIIDQGKVTGILTGCAVTPSSGLILAVAAGNGRSSGNLMSVAATTVTIGAAHATLDRFDMVVVDYPGTVSVVAGTASVTPVFPPASSPSVTAGRVVLAAVRVPATATTIIAANITDKRASLPQTAIESFVNGAFVGGAYRFGIAPGSGYQSRSSAQMDAELADYVIAGQKWLRVDIIWSTVEPTTKGTFVWTTPDLIVSRAALQGIKVLFTVVTTPGWARQAGQSGVLWSPPNDLGVSGSVNYNDFLTAAINRYKPGNVTAGLNGGSVSHWEIWNEPNLSAFWKDVAANPWPNPVQYVRLLKGAYTAAKLADSNSTIISGGLGTQGKYGAPTGVNGANTTEISPENFTEYMYTNGVKGSFDAFGWHPYEYNEGATSKLISGQGAGTLMSQFSDYNSFWQMYGSTHSLRKQQITNGDGGKPVWMTEFGFYALQAVFGTSTLTNEQQLVDQIASDYDTHAFFEWGGPLFYHPYGTYENANAGLVDTTAGVKRSRFWAVADRANAYGSS